MHGSTTKVLAVCDGGAEVALISKNLYDKLEPQPKLRPTAEQVKGLYGPNHSPLGECTILIEIPELAVAIEYDVVVDEIEEDLLIDAAMMHHAGIQLKYDEQELCRKNKTVKGVARLRRGAYKARRVCLQKDWVVPSRSRQLVPGRVKDVQKDVVPHEWIVEQSKVLGQNESLLVARTICSGRQVQDVVPVELYNPSDEPVQLFKNTTLGLVTPLDTVTDVKLKTDDGVIKTVHQVKKRLTSEKQLPEELEALVQETSLVLSPAQQEDFRNLMVEFRDVFATKDEPLGQTDVVQHHIKTEGDPIKCGYRRIPTGLKEEAVKEEERMKSLGVIEPSESPWAAPVVLVRKKDGTLRYCIDYRRLNTVTKKDSYPLPNIQDCLDSLDGAKYFSSMDLCSGYWQVQLSEDAKDKTSFYGAGGGLWRFKVMPFGLCNAPATFERLMERVLGQLQWQICLCYIDDILIYSRSVVQHMEHLRTVFLRLRQAKLKLKPKKCHFFQKEVSFLGHVVSEDGVSMDPQKVLKIQDCPAPQDVHEVRSMMGLFSYYRRFIPHFSEIARPIIRLTEKNRQFQWQDVHQEAFEKLKQVLAQASTLSHPRTEGLFILDTDASDEGIGAVLSQVQDGEERIIAFGSRTLSKTERNYCITRRELLAVVHFVQQYNHFLLGRHFLVRTDNSAVRYWTKIHSETYDPQGQTARWMVKLAMFDFEIKHRPGKQHSNADGVSRKPFLRCAQCETRHQGAYGSKRQKKVAVVTKDIFTQTAQERLKPVKPVKNGTRITPDVHSGGQRCSGRDSSDGSKVDHEGQASKNRALTRGQASQGLGVAQAPASSWMGDGVCLDRDVLRQEQLKDPASVDAFCWLRSGKKPEKQEILPAGLDTKFLWGSFDCLVLEDGLIWRKIGPLSDGTTTSTVYVPKSLRKEVLRQCHDTRTAGHFYFWKTLNKVKKHFTWGGLSKDVQLYCQACHVCATRKNAGRHRRAEMRRYDVGLPMEEVAIDLMGPFPESDEGNKYVLVVVDSFSKWMEAYPIPNIEARTVAEKLVLEFFSRFGVPVQVKTDRGRQFECELFKHMCLLLDVEHRMSTPFHPQGNSRVERMVKVVGNLISTFCRTYREWDRNLPLLTLAYRSTVHDVTGYTPNYVMTGREVSLPLDVMMGVLPSDEKKNVPEYVQSLKDRMEICFEDVRDNLKKSGEKQKKYYNLATYGKEYLPGDLVYLREKTRKKQVSPKLQPKWKGPCLIIKRFGTVYEVMTAFKCVKLFHFDLLKPCHTEDIPSWIKKARKRFVKRD